MIWLFPHGPLFALLLPPGQPVVDLEAYMGSLEKKQLSTAKMIEKLGSLTEQAATKRFDCK